MATAQASGGYDVEFCDSSEEYVCCICVLVLREPMQLPCGHVLCKSCLNDYKKSQNDILRCPEDRTEVDMNRVFPDKNLERRVLSQKVKCKNANDNCEWTGELRNLQAHVVMCEMCLMKCINGCGMDIQRNEMQAHWNECPLTVMPCSYAKVGCPFKGTKDPRRQHEIADVHNHLALAMEKVGTLGKELKNFRILGRELELYKSTTMDKQCILFGFYIWPINNYRAKLNEARKSNTGVRSEPFFTSTKGYNVRLSAYLNGYDHGKGTHISAFFKIMKGDNDASMKWPFTQKLSLTILHQTDPLKNVIRLFDPKTSPKEQVKNSFMRPSSDCNIGIGFIKFLSHHEIEHGGYLENDTIYLKFEI